MKGTKVSVLMAAYNAEKYIGAAITSILRQTLSDLELIIVVDESRDNSRHVVESFNDPRVRVIWNPVNRGECYARNLGVKAAQGQYLAVLDSDDLAHPDRLRRQVEFLDRNPDTCLVGTAFETIDESGRSTGVQRLPTNPTEVRWKLLFGNVFGHSTVMLRLEDVRAIGGYDEQLPFAQDFDLWVRLAQRARLAQLADVLTLYRVHSSSSTYTTQCEEKERSVIQIVAKAIRMLTGQTIDTEVTRALARECRGRTADGSTLLLAYSVLGRCLASMLASGVYSGSERGELVVLALEEVTRIANKNSDWDGLAPMVALRLVARHAPLRLATNVGVSFAARAILPSRAIRLIRRARQLMARSLVEGAATPCNLAGGKRSSCKRS